MQPMEENLRRIERRQARHVRLTSASSSIGPLPRKDERLQDQGSECALVYNAEGVMYFRSDDCSTLGDFWRLIREA